MTDSTKTACQEHADSTRRMLDGLWEAIDAGEDYEGADAQQYLDELPLQVVWETGEPFAVVLGIGGPHVEITGGGRSSGTAYDVHVYWAGETARNSGCGITRTGEYFRDQMEETA